MSTSLADDVAALIAYHETRLDVREDFDRAEARVLRGMAEEKQRTIEAGEYVLRVEPIPVVACRACGHALERPPFVPADFVPQRIEITKKIDRGAAA